MRNTLKYILYPLYYTFIDESNYDDNSPLFEKMIYTARFKLAARGIFINRNEKDLEKLRNKHSGERCFIIGNGPSLNKLDLTKLKNEITFGVNAIYLNYEKMQFHPTYYVVEDHLIAEDRKDEINQYKGPQLKFYGTFLRHLIKPDEKTLFMNVRKDYSKDNTVPVFSTNAVRFLGIGGSVSFLCLQLAYFMGFPKVYMIGFDHNYIVPAKHEPSETLVIKSETDDENHFSKDYFGKGYRWHDPQLHTMEAAFKLANEEFINAGKKVFNATVGGRLEIFERVDYNILF